MADPQESDFTTYHWYSDGKVIGSSDLLTLQSRLHAYYNYSDYEVKEFHRLRIANEHLAAYKYITSRISVITEAAIDRDKFNEAKEAYEADSNRLYNEYLKDLHATITLDCGNMPWSIFMEVIDSGLLSSDRFRAHRTIDKFMDVVLFAFQSGLDQRL